jgi:hypothetical protein
VRDLWKIGAQRERVDDAIEPHLLRKWGLTTATDHGSPSISDPSPVSARQPDHDEIQKAATELIKANAELVNCSMKQPRRTRTDHTVPFQEAAAFMFTSAWRTRGVTWQGLPFSVLTTRVVFFSPPLFTFQWFVPPPSCWGGRSQEFYIGGAKFEFFLQSHSYSHILSQLHVLTSFTYIFGFHLGQNKKSYEAIKYGYMNSFHIRCRWFRNFFDS